MILKSRADPSEVHYCACGCAQCIEYKPYFKYAGWPKYLKNHCNKAWNKGLTKETSESIRRTAAKLTGRKTPEDSRIKMINTQKKLYADKILVPWNKGLTKEDHPSLQVLADKIKKVVVTEQTRGVLSIAQKKRFKKYPVYSKGKTKENCEAINKVAILKKGKPTWIKGKNKYNSEGVAKISKWMAENRIGEKNTSWCGGKSRERYPTNFDKYLKNIIRSRDNFTCQLCAKVQSGRSHSVHHIDYVKVNLDQANLVTLCTKCHIKTNTNRKYWTDYFRNRINLKTEKIA